MSASRVCPRCSRWHDVTATCQQSAALQGYVDFTPGQQAAADAAETIAIARYRLHPRSGSR
jgi:hypothetical protein